MGLLVRSGLGTAVTGETHATGGFLYAHRSVEPRHGIEPEFLGETEIAQSKRWAVKEVEVTNALERTEKIITFTRK